MRFTPRRGVLALVALSTSLAALESRGEVVTYNVVSSQSQINLTAGGTLFGGQLTVTEQQANAITRYGGTIATDVTIGGPSFIGGGAATGINPTGLFSIPLQYSPNVNGASGTAPANYGLNFTAPVNFDIPVIEIPPDVIAALPAPLNTLVPSSLDLGVLSSVVGKVALRDIALEVESSGRIPRSPVFGTSFDANQTSIDIVGGYADINIAARLTQPNLLQKGLMQVLLSAVASAVPDIGLTVTSPSLFSLDIDLGFGFRLDLAQLPALPNTAATDGTITQLNGPPGISTLTLPVQFAAAAGIEDLLGDLASAIDFNLTFDFSGTLRATAAVPEASSVLFTGLATLAMAGAVARRRRRA